MIMPFAKFKSVREVSSEDSNCLAENLLKASAKKWRTKTIGDRVAYVVLELDEPYMITGIDIGNEFSAFIEVLVGKTSNTNDFTEILVTCSFMTPIESKNSTNPNRVRCFNKEALVPTAAAEKWQFIKLICTQPFNKHTQYGISFIKIHVAESEPERTQKLVAKDINLKDSPASLNFSQLGKFILREDSPDSDSESSTALFKRWKASERSDKDNIKYNASTRKAAALPQRTNAVTDDSHTRNLSITTKKSSLTGKNEAENGKISSKPKKSLNVLDRNRDGLAFGKDETSENYDVNIKRSKLIETIELEREQLRLKTEKTKERNEQKKKVQSPAQTGCKLSTKEGIEEKVTSEHIIAVRDPENTPVKKGGLGNESISKENVSAKVKNLVFRPFNQLLKGTILVISGIQEFLASHHSHQLAKFHNSTKNTLEVMIKTILICAFKNTPKYNQVKGKGKIVTRAWIEDCHKQKKKLPWRRYALDSSDLDQPDSEEEILDETLRPIEFTVTRDSSNHANLSISNSNSNEMKSFIVSSGSDTEDEIQKVLQDNNAPNNQSKEKSATKRTVFDFTTEEEEFLAKKVKLNSALKNGALFNGVKFFICDDIRSAERRRVEHLLRINKGSLVIDKTEAKYLISNCQAEVQNSSTNSMLIKPDWIYECNDMEMEVPIKKYIL